MSGALDAQHAAASQPLGLAFALLRVQVSVIGLSKGLDTESAIPSKV